MTPSYALGVDFGGTRLKAAWVAEDGRIDRFFERDSCARDGVDASWSALRGVLDDLRDGDGAAAVGIGMGLPGMIDPKSGALVGTTPHLHGWRDVAVRDELERASGLAATVDNDANLAGLAEHRLGAGKGARVFVSVVVGTGVGSGIVIDGAIVRGAWGGLGELGHLPIGSGELPCACGIPGCAEPEMSGEGLVRSAEARGKDWPRAEDVFAAERAGDPVARELIERMADRLGATLAIAVQLWNPDVIAIGGGVATAGEALRARVESALDRYALPSHRRGLHLRLAALGSAAGVVGAGLAAWDRARGSADRA
jgi:glucokinase